MPLCKRGKLVFQKCCSPICYGTGMLSLNWLLISYLYRLLVLSLIQKWKGTYSSNAILFWTKQMNSYIYSHLTVFKNKLLTKVDARPNGQRRENCCIKRPSHLWQFCYISFHGTIRLFEHRLLLIIYFWTQWHVTFPRH